MRRRSLVARQVVPAAASIQWLPATLSAACCSWVARRSLITQETGDDERVPGYFRVLGFEVDTREAMAAVTEEQLRLNFLQRMRELGGATRDPRKSGADRCNTKAHAYHATEGVQLTRNPNMSVAQESDKHLMREMQKTVEAYEALRSPSMRHMYGTHGCASLETNLGLVEEGGAFSAFNEHHQNFQFTDQAQRSFADYHESYRRTVLRWEPRQAPHSGTHPIDGREVFFTLRLSFDEAIHGCQKQIAYDRETACAFCQGTGKSLRALPKRCPQCNGHGQYELPSGTYLKKTECTYCSGRGETPPPQCTRCKGLGTQPKNGVHNVTVEPGVVNGSTWRLKGRGHDGFRGGRSGDLVVNFVVEAHRLFHRDGQDLHTIAAVSLSTALLGGQADVATLTGRQQAPIPPGAQTGTMVVLPGFGVPAVGGSDAPPGDLKVHLVVFIPNGTTLTASQRAAIRAFDTNKSSEDCATLPESDDALRAPSAVRMQRVMPNSDGSWAGNEAVGLRAPLDDSDATTASLDMLAEAKRRYRSWLPSEVS